jgi:hypothetical protein
MTLSLFSVANLPVNVEEFSSVSEEQGNSTMINGAESDRICCDNIIQSRYATAEAESWCDGWYHRDAARNKVTAKSCGERTAKPNTCTYSGTGFLWPEVAAEDRLIRPHRAQKRELYKLVIKYIGSFMSKPGGCKLFSYKFRMEADRPIVGYKRPTAFAVRPAVRQQIEQMLKDDILEASCSHFLNPLTTVRREDLTLHPRYWPREPACHCARKTTTPWYRRLEEARLWSLW